MNKIHNILFFITYVSVIQISCDSQYSPKLANNNVSSIIKCYSNGLEIYEGQSCGLPKYDTRSGTIIFVEYWNSRSSVFPLNRDVILPAGSCIVSYIEKYIKKPLTESEAKSSGSGKSYKDFYTDEKQDIEKPKDYNPSYRRFYVKNMENCL